MAMRGYLWSAHLCLAIMLAAPIMFAAYWTTASPAAIAESWMAGFPVPPTYPSGRFGAAAINLAYLGCALIALAQLRNILVQLAAEPRFHWTLILRATSVAHWLFATAAMSVLTYSAVPLILTWDLGPGHRVVAFGFDHGTLIAFFAGLLASAFARSAMLGQELADEQSFTV